MLCAAKGPSDAASTVGEELQLSYAKLAKRMRRCWACLWQVKIADGRRGIAGLVNPAVSWREATMVAAAGAASSAPARGGAEQEARQLQEMGSRSCLIAVKMPALSSSGIGRSRGGQQRAGWVRGKRLTPLEVGADGGSGPLAVVLLAHFAGQERDAQRRSHILA